MKVYFNLGTLMVAAAMLVSCHKPETVQAGYDPTTARDAFSVMKGRHGQPEIEGLLRGVDVPGKFLVMRIENGMDQTFKWDDNTEVTGVSPAGSAKTPQTSQTSLVMKELATRPGSVITVEWRDKGSERFATSIAVDDISPKNLVKSRNVKPVR